MCLRNISKDVSVADMKETGLNRYIYIYIYDFSLDYSSIDVSAIQDVHKYLMN